MTEIKTGDRVRVIGWTEELTVIGAQTLEIRVLRFDDHGAMHIAYLPPSVLEKVESEGAT